MKKMIFWLYEKRVYLWLICLVTVIIFGATVYFCNDWLNESGHENAIILLLSLWTFSVLTFYVNAVAVTMHSPMVARYGASGKGFLIVFFSLITLFCCTVGISIMFAL
ncbi:MAG: hypothetical protein KKC76_04725 [Proteobacteria bacterium]|nr:hypothetical protein [Pseudomonadota bacterium]MBU4294302.1 hypothetical protein [Pseudomonadota bacterium]MCG2746115.1 hypothetical protein [Desulfobulbaceae bacterium]